MSECCDWIGLITSAKYVVCVRLSDVSEECAHATYGNSEQTVSQQQH